MNDHKEHLNQYVGEIVSTINFLAQTQDVDILMERILTEARKIANADAGSIYKREEGFLILKYAQNDTKQKELPPNKKLIYETFSFPIDESTIAGFVAKTKTPLNIDDVYCIPSDLPYKFGKQVDEISGYRTKSMLTVPLLNPSKEVIGVLQLINAKDEQGRIVPFASRYVPIISFYGECASIALERAELVRTMILRMIKMAELRDPEETGEHVNRVGEYSTILYEKWAIKRGEPLKVMEKNKDALRVAAMLHDVGKIAISDVILKKKGRLTEEEYSTMKQHTYLGARLFKETKSLVDEMAREISLEHHERWDGLGYPGYIDLDTGEPLPGYEKGDGSARGKKGEEISLWGRIVSLADVFDALSSKRSYKEPWSREKIVEEISSQRGKQFDPELVDIFIESLDEIYMAMGRYS